METLQAIEKENGFVEGLSLRAIPYIGIYGIFIYRKFKFFRPRI